MSHYIWSERRWQEVEPSSEQPASMQSRRVETKATIGTTLQLWSLLLFAIFGIWNNIGTDDGATGANSVAPGWHAAGVIAAILFALTVLDGFVNRGRPTPKGTIALWRRRLRVRFVSERPRDGDDLLLGLLAGWFLFGKH